MHPMLNIAIRAARKAGQHITNSFDKLERIQIEEKSKNDYVTQIDKEAENIIIQSILESYPDHHFLCEESGSFNTEKDSDVTWIIDPLDGTTNFIKSFPHFSISIAAVIKGKTELACVYQPITNELFTAERGGGAQFNSQRIRVKDQQNLENAVIATGFPFKQKNKAEFHQKIMASLFTECADFRRTGSAALDLCYVASSRVNGYFEMGLKSWDIAAGELIAREAGALVTDFKGGPDYLKSGDIVCASPRQLKSILKHIRSSA